MELNLLCERTRALADRLGRRVVIGIVGAPGAGKSTLAEALVAALGARAVLIPMDGYHLSQRVLDELGLSDRKGAPETFDAAGLNQLLDRVHNETDQVVYFPVFDRSLEEPIAAGGGVQPNQDIVVVEGNYLLLDQGEWRGTRTRLDEAWSIEVDPELRRARLLARHVRFGRSPQSAADWVATVDEPNARRIKANSAPADLVIQLVEDLVP